MKEKNHLYIQYIFECSLCSWQCSKTKDIAKRKQVKITAIMSLHTGKDNTEGKQDK